MLLCRPQDLFEFLVPVRPALILGIATFLVFIVKMSTLAPGGSFSNLQVKLYVGLIVVMIISIPFALYRRAAFEFFFLQYINVVLFFFLFLNIIDSLKRLLTLLFVACSGTSLYLAFALMSGELVDRRLSFGGMFDPNDLAFFALSFLPLNLILISKNNNAVKRVICFSNVVISVLVVLETGSRGGFFAFCAVLLMLLLAKTITFKLSYKLLFVGLMAIVLLLNAGSIDFERYQGITNLEEDYNITDETGRLEVWKIGLRFMVEAPLTGVGIGCFPEAIGTDRAKRGLISRWQEVHNSLIQIGVETGGIGFLFFAVMSLNAFRVLGQAKKRAQSIELVKIAEMARMGFVGHFIAAMFLSQAYSVYWAFYMVFSAVVDRLSKQEEGLDARTVAEEEKGTIAARGAMAGAAAHSD